MKQKKIMVLFSFWLCLFSANAYTVMNQSATANGYTWTYSYDTVTGNATIYGREEDVGGEDEFVWITIPSAYVKGNVTVPSSLAGHTVVGIGEFAFANRTELTSITIPSTVTWVAWRSAFSGCTGLQSVKIGEGVTHIGSSAFSNCTALQSVTIPSSVTSIGSSAFSNCTALQSVTIPSSVTSIDNYTFYNCSRLTNVTIPSSVTNIGNYAFYNCTALQSVTIPSSVTNIGNSAFEGCSGLTSVTIPDSVMTFGKNAFYGCIRLSFGIMTVNGCMLAVSDSDRSTLKIGADIHCISDDVWEHCPYLETITVDSKNQYYKVVDGMLYSADGKTLVACPTDVVAVAIPESVEKIGASAFSCCKDIRSVTLNPKWSLSRIFPSVYQAITNVVFLDGTKSVCANVCSGCSKLTNVTIPSSVTSIGDYAFCYCSSLTSVTIPSSVTRIGDYAFSGCSGIRAIEIPASYSVSAVFPSAYSSITEITIPTETTTIGPRAYKGCSAVTAVEIPSSVTTIGASAFSGCSGLTSIKIPSCVTSIGSDAFWGCTALTRVDIDDLTAWCGINFSNDMSNPLHCAKHLHLKGSEVTALVIPADVSAIGAYSFCNMVSLIAVTIPQSVTSVNASAFAGCTGIRAVTIPSRFVLSSVFPDAYGKITSLTLLNGEPTVVANACSGCVSLTSVEIPADVKTLGSNAFKDCSNLTSVTFLGEAPACGDNVFAGTSPNLVVHAAPDSSGWMQWNGRPIAFDAQSGGGDDPTVETTRVELTVTNVVVCYIMNSVQPERVIPASMDIGYVNILTEVESNGAVSVPATWMVNYPNYVARFGSDFTQSLIKTTDKFDGAGRPMRVWQDYVAGTDPTDPNDVFTASVTIVDGKPVISYTPELSEEEKAKRVYTTYGKVKLQDKDWVEIPAGQEDNYNFFKVSVRMK